MKNSGVICLIVAILSGCHPDSGNASQDQSADEQAINQTIKDWDLAWETKDVALAIKYYADKTDWTNAFGARVQTKTELEALLTRIFNMDFVMAGKNNYGDNEVTFLNDSIATVRSQNIRTNQLWPDGTPMEDRYVNHLRVYKKISGNWLISDHMISQAWPTQAN
jgi:uncharacterized protein (TIGR02246 family)